MNDTAKYTKFLVIFKSVHFSHLLYLSDISHLYNVKGERNEVEIK